MWKWFFAILLLAASAAAQYWAIERRSGRVCRAAAELSAQAPRVRAWLADADADPFLHGAPFRGLTGAVVEEMLQRARWISSETSGGRLPPEAHKAYHELAISAREPAPLSAGLQAVAAFSSSLRCEGRAPAGEEGRLHFKVSEADRAWDEQKKQAEADKLVFAQDRLIYCKGDELLRSLSKVLATREARCKATKLPPKLAAACQEKTAEALDAEIADLEKQKDFNMKKLRQKWPEPVLKELACASPS